MTSTTRRGIVALIAVLLGSFVVAVPPAGAAAATQGFHVLNLTSKTLKLVSLTGHKENPELPRIATGGNLYPPGIEPAFEVTRIIGTDHEVEARFEQIDQNGAKTGDVTLVFRVDGWGYPYSRVPFRYNMEVEGDGENGKYLRIYEARPTTVDASSWPSRDQAALVGRMCRHKTDSDGGPVRCEGAITSEGEGEPTFAPIEIVDGPYGNNNCTPSEYMFSEERTKTLTNAWEIEASASYGVKDIWQAAVKTKYSGSYVTSEKYSHSEKHIIQPGTRVAMVSAVPVLRFIGEYSIRAGKTEWIMRDVPVDILDTSRPASRDFVASPINPNDAIAKKPSFCP